MSSKSRPVNQNRPWIKFLILLALATGVLGLQAYCLGRSDFGRSIQYGDNAERFVDPFAEDKWRRFCTQMLHLDDKGSLQILSGAVCDDEILLVISTEFHDRSRFHNDDIQQYELWRIDRRSGRIEHDRISPSGLDLVSDGQEVWILNADRGDLEHSSPFLWNGRPSIVAKHKADSLYQFFEWGERFSWEAQNQFLLLPQISLVDHFDIRSVSISAEKNITHILATERNDLVAYSYHGQPVGTRAQAEQFSQTHHIPHTKLSEQLAVLGWTRIQFEFITVSIRGGTVNGIWMCDADINVIESQFQDKSNLIAPDIVSSFQWSRYRNGQVVESRSLKAPSSISEDRTFRYNDESFVTFTSVSGEPYFAWADGFGRLHVMTLQNNQLRMIAQHTDLRIVFHILIAARDYTCCTFFPSLALGMCAWIVAAYRWRSSQRISVAEAELASTVRRGLARTVDLAILILIFASALVLHFDAIHWSTTVSDYTTSYVPEALQEALDGLNWRRLWNLQGTISELLLKAASPPLVWWLAVPGHMFLVAQVVCQGRIGQTVGKWLFGIKVVRSDGRRCGIPRSLLRELLLAVDSLFLLSWVPGVISILATTRSQRLGDIAADTVVVRVRPRTVLTVDRSITDAEPRLVR